MFFLPFEGENRLKSSVTQGILRPHQSQQILKAEDLLWPDPVPGKMIDITKFSLLQTGSTARNRRQQGNREEVETSK